MDNTRDDFKHMWSTTLYETEAYCLDQNSRYIIIGSNTCINYSEVGRALPKFKDTETFINSNTPTHKL